MRVSFSFLVVILSLTGCSTGQLFPLQRVQAPVAAACDPENIVCLAVKTPDSDTIRPQRRKGGVRGGAGFVDGTEPAKLDKTTEAEKQDALASTATGGEVKLGSTIASLGDVSQQGFWLKTPKVLVETPGRIVWAGSGSSVNVTLIPKQDASSGGSQISLAAMRALGVPLTDLPELVVYSQ